MGRLRNVLAYLVQDDDDHDHYHYVICSHFLSCFKAIPKLHQPLIPSYNKQGYVSGTVKIKSSSFKDRQPVFH